MNTYRIKETLDSPYDFVEADVYYVNDDNNLTFYVDRDRDEVEVATFRLWVSVVMMGVLEPRDRND